MYRGFSLELGQQTKAANEALFNVGNQVFLNQKRAIKNSLQNLVLRDGSLDASILQNQWFPEVEADIFISHSHRDEETAIILAGYLYENFNLTSFIDSTVWGYSTDLLLELDNKYCKYEKDGKFFYNYSTRNVSTSHVHLMLSGALTKMIDNTECVFFLDTPNSVKPNEIFESTLSPWIYSEILTTQTIRKRLPENHTKRMRITKSFSQGGQLSGINESFTMTHRIKTGHLTRIDATAEFFDAWHEQANNDHFKLDALYRMYPNGKTIIKG